MVNAAAAAALAAGFEVPGTIPVAAATAAPWPGFELEPDAVAPEFEAAVDEVVGMTRFNHENEYREQFLFFLPHVVYTKVHNTDDPMYQNSCYKIQ